MQQLSPSNPVTVIPSDRSGAEEVARIQLPMPSPTLAKPQE